LEILIIAKNTITFSIPQVNHSDPSLEIRPA
jgi:hypothetical protein